MTDEMAAIRVVADLMVLSARTSPKARGVDEIVSKIVTGDELQHLSEEMIAYGTANDIDFFTRDGKSVASSDACVLIGVHGAITVGVNCGGCGYSSCKDLITASADNGRNGNPFAGPNCIIRITDLGIAVGSAVKTAQIHNVDNRVMYSAGVAARLLGWLGTCSAVYGIPLKVSGKNIFFDR
jgi:uncharacterized ferredoxin-like protein